MGKTSEIGGLLSTIHPPFPFLNQFFCVFGGGIHGKFMEMGLCLLGFWNWNWIFFIGVFVGFLMGSICEELVKIFFFGLTRVNPSQPI